MRLSISLFLLTATLANAAAGEVVLKLSPNEDPGALLNIRAAVREARAANPGATVRVQFSSGRYRLHGALSFSSADSGTEGAPVIYEAAPGAPPVLDGGVPVSGWVPAERGQWKAKVPAGMHFEQLWVNGRRATRARTPNTGFLHMYSPAGADIFPGVKEPALRTFVLRPDDFALIAGIPQNERPWAYLGVMHTWANSHCSIKELHAPSRSVLINGQSRYPFVQFEPDQRYYIDNIRSGLDAPGEWFLDLTNGDVFYQPRPGEDMTMAEVTAPVAEQLIIMQGVQHVQFRGLRFEHTGYKFPADGYHDTQAASFIAGAMDLENVHAVHFSNCEIAHTANYGIFFRHGCTDSSVTHCRLHDLGAGGVRIGNTNMPELKDLTQRITVDDCIIQQGGRVFPSACGVFIAHAADCAVTHNDIGDFYYTGVSAGWVWGYSDSPSKRNRIDFNHIHHLGWAVLSDMGGVYLLGRAEGTTVSHNYVHHVAGFRYGGWGLYTDEGSTGVVMEINLVHDTTNAGFHQHYGKWNRISNNIFAFGQFAQIQRSRPEKHASFDFDHNIIIYRGSKLLDGSWYNWEPGTLEMSHNLYWNTAGDGVQFIDTDLAGWQKRTGRDEGSVVADPKCANPNKRDFTLAADSPALALGFRPFDHTQAGVRRTDQAWRALADSLVIDNWEKNALPWPAPAFSLTENFDFLSLGMPALPRSQVMWENTGDRVEVSEDQALSGKRSLKFLDAPGLKQAFNPHLVIRPEFTEGTAVVSFAVRFEPGAQFYTEWRDEPQPYRTGPSLWVRDGKLSAGHGQPLADLPAGEWIQVEITAGLGSKATGSYALKVTLPGAAAREWSGLPCGEDWKSLEWLGFISNATTAVAFYIDDLRVQLTP